MPDSDVVDFIRTQWSRERPDLDCSGFAVVGRILRLGKLLERRVTTALDPLDISLWAFDVLATLRRHGPPFRMTPGELSRATLLTPGAMTNRIDRLEDSGMVRREAEPSDGRGVRVVLTRRGRTLIDRAIEARMAEASGAVECLSARDRTSLEKILRRMMKALDVEES